MALRFQKGDLVAVALVVLLALAMLFLPATAEEPAQAEIYQNGKKIATLPLSHDGSFTVEGAYTNVITVEDGRVFISASTCPGQDCVHSGAIASTGRSLVCLPNGVEVRIVGKSDDVDFVVG